MKARRPQGHGDVVRSTPRPQVKAGKCRFLVDEAVFPQTLSVLRTRAAHLDIDMVVMSREAMRGAVEAGDVFGSWSNTPTPTGRWKI